MSTSDENQPPGDDVRVIPSDETTPEVIAPAPVGVAAFVGHSRLGTIGAAIRCDSVSTFNRHFGGFEEAPVLACAVKGFFENGGMDCFIVNLGEQERPLKPRDLEVLVDEPDIEMVCAPGKVEPSDYQVLLNHCSTCGTRLALLDGPADLARRAVSFHPPASHCGALYVPWLLVYDPSRRKNVEVPPSGHMAGLFARVAREKGVKKAPANELLYWMEALTHDITQAEQDILHPRRINCIRKLPKLDGIRPWGTQTLADRGPFQSISPFRVFSYVVRSFETASKWLAGSTSDPEAWGKLLEAGRAFLTQMFEAGELMGETPDEAFRLRCDAQLNTPSHRDEGVVMIEIGLAMGRPNAFYTFQMGLPIC